MAKTAASIRKGFDYQDFYCAHRLLEFVRCGDLNALFQIESDEVDHVDDLVIKPTSGVPCGHQVKFHVDQSKPESFELFVEKRSSTSTSLLQKLFRGWQDLSRDGESQCEIHFISSVPPASGRSELGAAISSENKCFRAEFYDQSRFARGRNLWLKELQLDQEHFRTFLASIRWHLGNRSLHEVRESVVDLLQQLRLPHHETALLILRDKIAQFATDVHRTSRVSEFLHALWDDRVFREACEQHFPNVEFGTRARDRAKVVRIAVASLRTLPAFVGESCASLEEPIPVDDHDAGLTTAALTSLLERERQEWLDQYLDWLLKRVQFVLRFLEPNPPDLLVFPRFSLPPAIADHVFKWSQRNACNVAIGAHSVVGQAGGLLGYTQTFNVRIVPETPDENPNTIVDSLVRPDRTGRALVSTAASPGVRKEKIETELVPVELTCHDGTVVTAIALPSATAVHRFLEKQAAVPELVICSSGEHSDELYRTLQNSDALRGVLLVLASSQPTWVPLIAPLKGTAPPRTTNEWEGVVVCTASYDRGLSGFRVTTADRTESPLVYVDGDHPPSDEDDSDVWRHGLRGLIGSLQAASSLSSESLVICSGVDDPDRFFLDRANSAITKLKELLPSLSGETISILGSRISLIEAFKQHLEARTKSITRPTATVQTTRPAWPPAVGMVDRAGEAADIGRFVEGTDDKRVLYVYGPPGIGKRSIIEHARRNDPSPEHWLETNCPSDAGFDEFLHIVLDRLGNHAAQVRTPDTSLYNATCRLLAERRNRVLVIHGAENLPLHRDEHQHAEFLAFLSVVCRSALPVRVMLVSRSWAQFNFKGSHRIARLQIAGLDDSYSVMLLQSLIQQAPRILARPSISDLHQLGRRIHGYPILARIVALLLDHLTADEILDSLHEREEIRSYIVGDLLGRSALSPLEESLLCLASMFRIPVDVSAFATVAGSRSHSLVRELAGRLILRYDDKMISLHALLREHFSSRLDSMEERRKLHDLAFQYFEDLRGFRELSAEEWRERLYHAVRSGRRVSSGEFRAITAPARSAIIDSLRSNDYECLESASNTILDVIPNDAMARVAKAIALDAAGRSAEAADHIGSIQQVQRRDLWIALRFAANRVRKRDFDFAEQLLSDLQTRFGANAQIHVGWAQLFERKGLVDDSVDHCRKVLSDDDVHPADAFRAGLILRNANQLSVFIDYSERVWNSDPDDTKLRRLFAYACVVTNHDPDAGLQILAELHRAKPYDAYTLADYAAALGRCNRTSDAEQLFKRGVSNQRYNKRIRAPILDEYARFLDARSDFDKAHPLYEELLRTHSYDLHIQRRYAKSLHEAARQAHAERSYPKEDSLNRKARQVLRTLLEAAPDDEWAANYLQNVENRIYGATH